jgi:hypothetical protein
MDSMNITVLEDGSLKIETDKISQANHMTAEAFMRNIASACGGKQERKHKQGFIGSMLHTIQHTIGHNHNH